MTRNFSIPAAHSYCAHLLASGDWATMITPMGEGFSRWKGLAINRWREGGPPDENGSLLLLRDRDDGRIWSTTARPAASDTGDCAAMFDAGCARFTRHENGIGSLVEIAPLPEGYGELRRITLTNDTDQPRRIEVVSYMALILGDAAADAAHPAFSKMFTQTEAVEDGAILLAWRRPREPAEPAILAAHLTSDDGAGIEDLGFETDRMRFIGRGGNLRRPAALQGPSGGPGHTGTVLDPIFSLRRGVTLAPAASQTLCFWTLVAGNRADLLARAQLYRAGDPDDAVFKAAVARGHTDVTVFQTLAAPLLMDDACWRATEQQLTRAAGGTPRCLWPHGISGVQPIVLVTIDAQDQLGLVHELQAAQAWWWQHQLAVDLVMIAEGSAFLGPLRGLVGAGDAAANKNVPYGLFALDGTQLTAADRDGLAAAARVVLAGRHGDLAAQIARTEAMRHHAPPPVCAHPPPQRRDDPPAQVAAEDAPEVQGLAYFNGFGGFAGAGREYQIYLDGGICTPQPWVNIIGHEDFGFMVSAEGGGYAWAGNSQTNTLTRWSNDAVRDPAGDTIYLRDMDSTRLWGATPRPMGAAVPYRIRHGLGFTGFDHDHDGIESRLTQFVPMGMPVKLSYLRLRNTSSRHRRLQVTGVVRWMLGPNGAVTPPHVVTAHDDATGILTAQNRWRTDYADRLAFADLGGRQTGWTCDRAEIFGPDDWAEAPPALLAAAPLGARCGAGLAPCAALQTEIQLAPGESTALIFLLGEAADIAEARALATRLRAADPARLLADARAYWHDLTSRITVETPNDRLDLMVNGWLPYQIISCRLHARTAFYQASGAFGFRDQLQDVSALPVIAPDLARTHIIRAAGRQFPEGDVQHWWLPPTGAGLRTRMVDDRLWLPFVLAHHVAVTGDQALLDEATPFLTALPLPEGRLDDFTVPATANESGSLYEHAARAIDASLANGAHGLPLFGTGDWNDGMNRVGWQGSGESVWMGWFLLRVIADFAPLADARGDATRARRWRDHAAALTTALETHAWDGNHWLRGWYDDGTVLGGQEDTECRIDGIAQSWAVLSGAADPARSRQAMHTLDRMLVDREYGIVALLAPAFDKGGHDPGYIKGYPPGLRENGGQYTHGSVWAAIAFAQLGDGDLAHELFDMLLPVRHGGSPEAIARFQVEPYIGCADVYTAPGLRGRGGWTWYTGSAGWLYRCAVEWILGLRVVGQECRLTPCIPRDWPGFALTLRWRSARYRFEVSNPDGAGTGLCGIRLDGARRDPDAAIPLWDDGKTHLVQVQMGHSQNTRT